MKLDVISEKHNPIMERKEVKMLAVHPEEATPTKASVQQLAAKHFKADVTKVDVRNIFSKIGSSKSDSLIFIWDNQTVDDLSKKKEVKEETKTE